jgi:Dolichyl-phosphate-mannose-protein mannosyltransferase
VTESTVQAVVPAESVPGSALPAFAWIPVTAVAAGVGVLLAATAGRYDYHRDELYFRVLGQRLAWGYVDQPPLPPLLARVSTAVLGDSLWALRLPALLCVLATVFLLALIARELGGGRAAQVLAALGGAAAFPLIAGHTLATATADLVVWTAVILCVLRALLRDQPRWWLAAGVLVGLGLYNKYLIVLLLLGLGGGLLLAGPRRVLRSGYLWAGVVIALVIGFPNLVYQVTHDWPQFKMAQALRENKGEDARITFVPLQLVMVGLLLVPVWIAGWVRVLRTPAIRALAVAYPLICVILLLIAGQPYYTLGLLLALYAAGCVAAERWFAGRPGRRAWVVAAVVLNIALSVVISLPVLPVAVLAKTPIPAMNQVIRDQIGWQVYVRQVADAYRTVPAGDRADTVIVTGNYGEQGALDRYGGRYHLPHAYSGQNELYYRARPPESATTVILVGYGRQAFLDARFESCRVAGHLDNGVDIDNEEEGNSIFVCRGPRGPWRDMWPRFQHYD